MKKIKFIDGTEAVLVVRCKECKHWRNEYGDGACMRLDAWIDADGFCSYGERGK